MPLTRDFRQTVMERLAKDPELGRELLREAIECLLSGDIETGKALLRDYVNGTVGFEALAQATKKSPKSLMRMLGPTGNPQARNLFEVIGQLRRAERVQFEVLLKSTPRARQG